MSKFFQVSNQADYVSVLVTANCRALRREMTAIRMTPLSYLTPKNHRFRRVSLAAWGSN